MGNAEIWSAAALQRGAATEPPLRDADIRSFLNEWLLAEHSEDPTTVVYEELSIPRPSSRADFAVVNGSMIAYEIKSDVDSVARLAGQINSYNMIFDHVFLVTTKKKIQKISPIIPNWWGIIVAEQNRSLRKVRRSKKNRNVSREHVLHILTKKELINISRKIQLAISSKSKKEDIIKFIISKKISYSKISKFIRMELKARLN